MAKPDYYYPLAAGGVLMGVCWLFGIYHVSCIWLILMVVLGIATLNLTIQRERHLTTLRDAMIKEKEIAMFHLNSDHLKGFEGMDEMDQVEWLNKILVQLWQPYINESSKQFTKDIVEPHLRALLPAPLKGLTFDSVDMGTIPARVKSIKVHTETGNRDRIVMDVDLIYSGDCEFVTSVAGFKSTVRQLQFKGKLRVVLKPLIPYSPLIGAISLYLMDEPFLDFNLSGLGPLVELPGVMNTILRIMRANLASICILPNQFVFPLAEEADTMHLNFPEPEGVARIHVFGARDLQVKDVALRGGKSDPYVRITVGGQFEKTKTVSNTLNPVWDEYFQALVQQSHGQHIFLDVYDQDVASNDNFLGKVSVDLAILKKMRIMDSWFPLEGVKRGELRLRIFWMDLCSVPIPVSASVHASDANLKSLESTPTAAAPVFESTPLSTAAVASVKLPRAVLLVTVENVEDLPSLKKHSEPTPFMILRVGKQEHRTFPKPDTRNPVYRQCFIFFIDDVSNDFLTVQGKDEKTGESSLGEANIPIAGLLNEQNLQLYRHNFELVSGPHSSTLVLSLRLRFISALSPEALKVFETQTVSESGYQLEVNPAPVEPQEQAVHKLIVDDQGNGYEVGDEALRHESFSSRKSFSSGVSSASAASINAERGNAVQKAVHKMVGKNTTVSNKLVKKKRKRMQPIMMPRDGYGKLEMSLVYVKDKKNLMVTIHNVRDLKAVNEEGIADPFVKLRLLKEGQRVAKHSTDTKYHTLNPSYDETFTFDIEPDEIHRHLLVVDVKDAINYGLFASTPVLGQLMFNMGRFDGSKTLHNWFDLSRPFYDEIYSSKMSLH